MRVRDARLSKGQRFGMAVGGLVALAVALPVLDAPPSSIDTTDPKRIGIWSLQLTGHIPFWPDVQATTSSWSRRPARRPRTRQLWSTEGGDMTR